MDDAVNYDEIVAAVLAQVNSTTQTTTPVVEPVAEVAAPIHTIVRRKLKQRRTKYAY